MTSKPRMLDLFAGAGGSARGYQQAGFHVTGVDVKPSPRYGGDEFVQADVFDLSILWMQRFDAVHASPPCQHYSVLAAMHPDRTWPDLIEPTRALLHVVGLPWIIENVENAPLLSAPGLFGSYGTTLCGSMFGLGVERGYLRRHRKFESSIPLAQPPCRHKGHAVGVYGHGGHSGKHRMLYRKEAAEAMQIDWMTRDEMTQAIPPAFTAFLGSELLSHLSTALSPGGN